MKQVSGKALCRLLEQQGWELKRINGSHHIFVMQGQAERIFSKFGKIARHRVAQQELI